MPSDLRPKIIQRFSSVAKVDELVQLVVSRPLVQRVEEKIILETLLLELLQFFVVLFWLPVIIVAVKIAADLAPELIILFGKFVIIFVVLVKVGCKVTVTTPSVADRIQNDALISALLLELHQLLVVLFCLPLIITVQEAFNFCF